MSFTFCMLCTAAAAQRKTKDSLPAHQFPQLQVTGFRTVNGIGHHPGIYDNIIYAGEKNGVIIIDSMNGNKAINNTRQILG